MKIKYEVTLTQGNKVISSITKVIDVPAKTGKEDTGFMSMYWHGETKNTSPYSLFESIKIPNLTEQKQEPEPPKKGK